MTFIDTHCHLYDEAFDADRDDALQRALDAGVTTLLLPDIDSTSTPRLEALLHSSFITHHSSLTLRPMAGLHPTSVKEDFEQELQHVHSKLKTQNSKLKYVAVGEIGMDLYWDRTFEAEQRQVLRTQMLWAEELDLPVCLHIRKAHNEVFGLLRDLNRRTYRGVMHCFGGSVQEAQRAVEMGFHLGVGGVVTFKNAGLADVVRAVPLERLLLETDTPYLSPVPHRGQRNEPSYIPLIAQRIADLRGITLDEVADVTTASAHELFRL
ncbi:MAG: TatD family hydrolase [Bacteroidales bacterium]|nr:TatD family hydrolase [Bacteroidales bacterium]